MDTTLKRGDIVRPADGSNDRYIIFAISNGFISYRCLRTNKEYTKDRFGFFCRFSTLAEYDRRQAELEAEEGEDEES